MGTKPATRAFFLCRCGPCRDQQPATRILAMTTPMLRYGRRPPKNAPALRLAPLLAGVLLPPPSHVDYGTDFTGWQMLGNDVAGDCVAVTWANQRALVTTALSHKTDYPSQSEVWTFYQTQNPNFNPNGSATGNGPGSPADGGMDIQTALEYAVNHGGPDGLKAVAFAAVDYTKKNEPRPAHAIFGQVWYGINVLIANQTEFSNGQPWDYVAGSPLDGGHSITGIGYDPTDYRFVTWAQETEWTEAFRTHQVEEAWVVIWPEHFGTTDFEQGMNLKQLAADYQAITGNTLNIPQPPQRIGVLTTAGDALVKQGALNAAWVTEYSGVTQLAVTDNRVGVLTTAGDALVKQGALNAAWVTEYSGVTQLAVTDNRVGVLTTAGDALVKQGALNAAWVTEYSGVTQLAVTDNRVGVLTTAGDALVKEGALNAA